MFIAVLFTIAKIWKQLKCPSTDEWIKMRYIYVYSCLETPMNKMKRQKETTVVDVSGGEGKI